MKFWRWKPFFLTIIWNFLFIASAAEATEWKQHYINDLLKTNWNAKKYLWIQFEQYLCKYLNSSALGKLATGNIVDSTKNIHNINLGLAAKCSAPALYFWNDTNFQKTLLQRLKHLRLELNHTLSNYWWLRRKKKRWKLHQL